MIARMITFDILVGAREHKSHRFHVATVNVHLKFSIKIY